MNIIPFAANPAYIHTPARIPNGSTSAWRAAQDFETQFISAMTQSMFEGVTTDGPFDGGQGESVFRSMLVEQYSKEITRAGGIGLADQVYREILKLQEHAK